MPTVRIRVIGTENDTAALIAVLHGIDGVEHVEEVADLMPHMDDPDSSSAGMAEDIGPGVHAIEVEARDSVMAEQVRMLAENASDALESSIEFVDEF
jgi:hypothetical protein